MVEEKGLAGEAADRIGEYVKLHGGLELLEKLCADTRLVAVKAAEEGLRDMRLLLHYCELFGVLDKVCRREEGRKEGGGREGGKEGRREGGEEGAEEGGVRDGMVDRRGGGM